MSVGFHVEDGLENGDPLLKDRSTSIDVRARIALWSCSGGAPSRGIRIGVGFT